MSQVYSLIEYFGYQKVSSCGYCKTSRGHSDYGSSTRIDQRMWLYFLTVMDYQNLIDRGWRRSGLYGYKPVMREACCALYTIRCAALDLRLTRSQKKLIKRFNCFIVSGERKKLRSSNNEVRENEESHSKFIEPSKSVLPLERINIDSSGPSCSVPVSDLTMAVESSIPEKSSEKECDNKTQSNRDFEKSNKKKSIRIERAKKRVMATGKTEEEAIEILKSKKKVQKLKTLEEFLGECRKTNVKHKLEIKLVQSSPPNEEFDRTFDTEYEVYCKYQVVIHKDKATECTPQQFRRFLVSSPLHPQPIEDTNAPIQSFGSYHQQYWLDGKLIAVGVIDILPYCISSVYFFYDPDYHDLTLGSYGSMIELQLARELHKFVPSLRYYYMGYYIHTCSKMRYKARISPSYLLCPETYTFHPIDRCLEKITQYGVCRLHPDPNVKDDSFTDSTEQVMVLVGQSVLTYQVYRQRFKSNDQDEVKEFVKVVGKKCVDSLVLLRAPR